MTKQQRQYIKAMQAWAKEIAEWQIRNPEKDWMTELAGLQTADGGGDRPPQPPPKP